MRVRAERQQNGGTDLNGCGDMIAVSVFASMTSMAGIWWYGCDGKEKRERFPCEPTVGVGRLSVSQCIDFQ